VVCVNLRLVLLGRFDETVSTCHMGNRSGGFRGGLRSGWGVGVVVFVGVSVCGADLGCSIGTVGSLASAIGSYWFSGIGVWVKKIRSW
jgi:hypothetical protein